MTGGMGPDSCIDCVGLEAHGTNVSAIYDWVKNKTGLATDRLHVLRQVLFSCRKGGTVSIPGVYGGLLDKVPFGAAFNKGLTLKMGQTHVQKYLPRLLEHIQKGDIDPSFVITHRINIEEAPEMYKAFETKQDNCIKIVIPMDGSKSVSPTAHEHVH
jgi:threonine dehydrogenase-like Zn-dependent dehydrogenase